MFGDKEYKQLEFFEELTKPAGRKFRRFKLPYIGQKRVLLKVSYEKVVLFGIGFILASTLIFSFGVERGKKLSKGGNAAVSRETEILRPEAAEPEIPKISEENPHNAGDSQLKQPTLTDYANKEFFTIQIVTYKSMINAEREKELIKRKGLQAFILKKENYFLVCAGEFDNSDSARTKLAELKKTYRDCFIKKVKRGDLYNE